MKNSRNSNRDTFFNQIHRTQSKYFCFLKIFDLISKNKYPTYEQGKYRMPHMVHENTQKSQFPETFPSKLIEWKEKFVFHTR